MKIARGFLVLNCRSSHIQSVVNKWNGQKAHFKNEIIKNKRYLTWILNQLLNCWPEFPPLWSLKQFIFSFISSFPQQKFTGDLPHTRHIPGWTLTREWISSNFMSLGHHLPPRYHLISEYPWLAGSERGTRKMPDTDAGSGGEQQHPPLTECSLCPAAAERSVYVISSNHPHSTFMWVSSQFL